MNNYKEIPSYINYLIGKTILGLEINNDSVSFKLENDEILNIYHEQDCCENVYIFEKTYAGNLVGEIITEAYETDENLPNYTGEECHTWTKFVIKSANSELVITFLGESNGCYDESVSVVLFQKDLDKSIKESKTEETSTIYTASGLITGSC